MTSTTETARAAKAEALLLHFTAEAHRRKWSYDRGLDDDGVPIKSEAFDALHRLGEEMRKELEALRCMPDAPPVSSSGRAALLHETALSDTERRILDYALDLAEEEMLARGDDEDELEALKALRRVAAEEQPAETGCRRCGHRACMGNGRRCGVVMTSDTGTVAPPCQCIGPAVGEQPDTQTREAVVVGCGLRTLRRDHAPHDWEPQPGLTVHCLGHAPPLTEPAP